MILVTGAAGFVGSALIERLALEQDISGVIAVIRNTELPILTNIKLVNMGDISPFTDWNLVLKDVGAIVHCAARVHVMKESSADPLEEFRQVNVHSTLNLARQAAIAGVKRFVYLSSIKVNGEATVFGCPFTAEDIPSPQDAYGISKMEAEQGLRDLSAKTGMELVILRPPLVYGPGVKANFASMLKWVASGVPLPLGGIHNARSMVALGNLVDLLIVCLKHPAAAGNTFLVSDGEDVSTTELLERTANAMGKIVRLYALPTWCINLLTTLFGKQIYSQRLLGSLQVDIEKTRRLLNWNPPLSLDDCLKMTIKGIKQ